MKKCKKRVMKPPDLILQVNLENEHGYLCCQVIILNSKIWNVNWIFEIKTQYQIKTYNNKN
jgi:hypothetical protein